MDNDGLNKTSQEDVKEIQHMDYAIIDALNGAYSRNDGKARLSDLLSIAKLLNKEYDRIEIIADASARHKIDNKSEFERLVRAGKIQLCPAGVDGDDLIWMRAKSLSTKEHSVTIISNDMFPIRRAKGEHTSISNKVVSIFPDGEIYFIERSANRYEASNRSSRGQVQMIELGNET